MITTKILPTTYKLKSVFTQIHYNRIANSYISRLARITTKQSKMSNQKP